jgi:hypothetical protein
VDDEIDLAAQELALMLCGEDADHAELMEFRNPVLVGDGRDGADLEFDLGPDLPDEANDEIGLGESEGASTCPDPEQHVFFP